ncbi:hypothetical protein APX70_200582 [Pseudomonas syringae pv. maculicola]|uniref:Uncharacterized protein n=1 Tax=Pseudomonas syringae pv. maculicola TaxID=59511 RepID=A0A3M2WNX7_PSEYM|nr:hypothetical protein APX70_200582 [Pseudomonas syringae pv. maculicola]
MVNSSRAPLLEPGSASGLSSCERTSILRTWSNSLLWSLNTLSLNTRS